MKKTTAILNSKTNNPRTSSAQRSVSNKRPTSVKKTSQVVLSSKQP